MTAPDLSPNPRSGGYDDPARFGVRCPRCARTQPPVPQSGAEPEPPRQSLPYCVYCGTPLSTVRWVADTPPGLGPAPYIRRVRLPYFGPPHYGPSHPLWGFPTVAVVASAQIDPAASKRATAIREVGRRLSVAIVLSFTTTFAALASGAAELWRFTLMLQGRTEVLPAEPVSANAVAVSASSTAAALLSVLTLLSVTSALAVLTSAAAARSAMLPPRSHRSLVVRMLVPGWNLYGAGQVVAEAFRALLRTAAPLGSPAAFAPLPRRIRTIAAFTWAAWIANGLLASIVIALSLLRVLPTGWAPAWAARWSASNQFAANLVELHIALNALAALTAALVATVLALLRDQWRGGRRSRRDSWIVAQPTSTARNLTLGSAIPDDDQHAAESTAGAAARDSADTRADAGKHGRR